MTDAAPTNLGPLNDEELIALWGEVMAAMLERGIVHSGNNPIADIAERLVADHYGVDPEPPNQKGFDVKTPDGERVQVKALRRTKSGSTGLSAIRSTEFEILAAVIFGADMKLEGIAVIPIAAVKDHMGWSNTWGANSLSITKKLMADPRVDHLSVP